SPRPRRGRRRAGAPSPDARPASSPPTTSSHLDRRRVPAGPRTAAGTLRLWSTAGPRSHRPPPGCPDPRCAPRPRHPPPRSRRLPAPPAGGYRARSGQPRRRYYDGRRWTIHTASPFAPGRAAHRQLPIVVAIGALSVLLASLIASRILLEHIVQFGWPIVV